MESYAGESSPEVIWSGGGEEAFGIDDLLDFSCEDIGAPTGGAGCSHGEKSHPESAFSEPNSGDSSVTETEAAAAAAATCDEVSRPAPNVVEVDGSGGVCLFSGELCVPADALEELEWLSTFVDDSFVAVPELVVPVDSVREPSEREESQRKQSNALLAGAGRTWVLGRARSKRSRCVNPAVFVSVALKNDEPRTGRKAAMKGSVCVAPPAAVKKAKKGCQSRSGGGQESRRCSHCLVQKTPQWRTGPLGPKTLCNACGVRFKSGRLLPEYRPALSPTFSSGLHSNCHRRVVEIRRQRIDQQQPLSQQETSSLTDNSMTYYS
uniref:GATA transcription factor n=1 Tax=Picea sitchensis TaxID=3332 RepID=B8LKB3_PICSI|nr:unknown [Picea sitchensis]